MPPKKKPEAKVTVAQDPEKLVEHAVLAQAIIRLSEAAQSLTRLSGLNEEAIVTLLNRSSKVPRRDIQAVLYAMKQLKRDYCA